jgi:phosphoheptose isomerase
LVDVVAASAAVLIDALRQQRKILVCGNGGSAAQAQHLAAEIVGRFEAERRALPCMALTTDSSILTAWSNDRGFDGVYARQISALGQPGDVLVAISTSGDSASVLRAMDAAAACGMVRVTLSGRGGGQLAAVPDATHVIVPSDITARVQEVHLLVVHLWCRLIDDAFAG